MSPKKNAGYQSDGEKAYVPGMKAKDLVPKTRASAGQWGTGKQKGIGLFFLLTCGN